jgi:hypothetical protein
MHLHPVFAVCIIPLLFVTALLSIPYLRYETDPGGIWFGSPAGRQTAIIAALIGFLITPMLIILDDKLIEPARWFSGLPPIFSNGLIPSILIALAILTFYLIMKRKFTCTKNETVQAVFILLVTAFAVLTVTGAWFRGKGMALAVPW